MGEVTDLVGDMWKENLNEWVYEETKIITYKWLSKQISVHVNIAKQMLFEFVQQSKENNKSSLEVIYLIAGRIATPPHSIKVCLVKSIDLSKKEAEFKSITSKHVYAIAKSQPGLLTETNMCQVDLSIRNNDDGNDTNFSKYSAIGNKKAVPTRLPNFDKGYVEPKKESTSKPDLPKKEPPTKPSEAKKSTGIQGMLDKQTSNAPIKASENKVASKDTTSAAKQKPGSKKTSAKGSVIAGMFAKAPAKQTTSTTIAKKESEPVTAEKSKQTSFESENSPGKENRINVEIEEKKDEAIKAEKSQNGNEYIKKESLTKDPKHEDSNRHSARSDKKRPNISKKNETQAKRRKRIQVMSESESDEENDTETENVAPPSPPPPQAKLIESDEDELLPPTPKVAESKCKPGKHRVKKQVSKTFVDEDGFMVTKKVMESCSETDEEPETSNIPAAKASAKDSQKISEHKNTTPNIKPKTMVAQNNKQSSIMSFFQKK